LADSPADANGRFKHGVYRSALLARPPARPPSRSLTRVARSSKLTLLYLRVCSFAIDPKTGETSYVLSNPNGAWGGLTVWVRRY
jgi:hypothetical protein